MHAWRWQELQTGRRAAPSDFRLQTDLPDVSARSAPPCGFGPSCDLKAMLEVGVKVGWPACARWQGGQPFGVAPCHDDAARMIAPSPGVRVWLAAGVTDMRKGFDGLAVLVQQHLGQYPGRPPLRRPPGCQALSAPEHELARHRPRRDPPQARPSHPAATPSGDARRRLRADSHHR